MKRIRHSLQSHDQRKNIPNASKRSPSPGGEGRGEGEQHSLNHSALQPLPLQKSPDFVAAIYDRRWFPSHSPSYGAHRAPLQDAVTRHSILIYLITFLFPLIASAQTWQDALAKMPLTTNVTELNRTNVAALLLSSFQSNQTVKAFVMMPGATDEFYFFRRATARLTNAAPTLLDAVVAMTNQTHIRVLFRPPLLLLHTEEDPLEPLIRVSDTSLAAKLKTRPFLPYFSYNDRDWDFLQPVLVKNISNRWLGLPEFLPPPKTSESWHFFRHTVAGWNLTQWEALEALSLAGKTTITIRRSKLIFEGDVRTGVGDK